MADQPEKTPNIYALLIGIDGYNSNLLSKNLKGCVRDINLVADYLLKTVKIPSERIFRLTSPNPEVAQTIATKDPEPTYANIVAQFKAITELAQPGEQVYIHYSGHGGRTTTIYPELKGNDQLDEGIVPMDVGNEGGRNLLDDVELATLLKRMTDKGLIVTLVLDSCHSGEATRGDDVAIRATHNIDTAQRDLKSLVAERQELIKNWRDLTDGIAASITPGRWLPQSSNYVLLAACRPSEYAYEYAVSGKERHGALTYWMIDTLTSSPSGLTYKTLHDRVSAKIQSKFRQMPMLVGESDRFVFGVECGSLQYAVNVLEIIEEEVTDADSVPKKVPKQVRLDAGMANGLSPGYRFAIYPFGTTDFTHKNKQVAIVEIAGVGASDAWADVIEVLRQDKIDQGSQAVMLSAPVELVRGVRLFKKEVGEKDNELPQAIKNQEDTALKAVEAALAGNGWLKLADAQQKGDYQVAVNLKGEYEICTGTGTPIENLTPALKIDDSHAPQEVVKRLVHLVKYQAIQQLSNQFSELTGKLEVELLTQPSWRPGMPKKPQPFPDRTNLVVQSGEYAFLRIKNISSQELQVAVLDLEPNWAVSRIQLQKPEAIFYSFKPNQEMLIALEIKLPASCDSSKGKERFKVFATVRPNDFRWLELPSLDQGIDKKSAKPVRGDNPLGQLLAAVGADVDTQLSDRRSTAIFDPSDEWTTEEIQITLTR